jgi:hypothetical protein
MVQGALDDIKYLVLHQAGLVADGDNDVPFG